MELRELFVEKGVYPQAVLSDGDYFSPFNLSLPSPDGEAKSPLDGLNYDTLGDYQTQFNLRTIRCVIIKQNEPKADNSSVYEIFDRLNTGGVNLKPQEIRANLYYSEFYAALYEMNKDIRWRKIIGQAERDTNLRDVELLLRVFAMLAFSDEYKPSMVRFLNRFSAHARKNYKTADVAVFKQLFDKFLQSAESVDASAFRLSDRFSIGLFEAALYASARTAWERRDSSLVKPVTKKTLDALGKAIRPYFQEGTSKTDNVKGRLKSAQSVI